MFFCVCEVVLESRRYSKGFLIVFGSIFTTYQPLASHGDPKHIDFFCLEAKWRTNVLGKTASYDSLPVVAIARDLVWRGLCPSLVSACVRCQMLPVVKLRVLNSNLHPQGILEANSHGIHGERGSSKLVDF